MFDDLVKFTDKTLSKRGQIQWTEGLMFLNANSKLAMQQKNIYQSFKSPSQNRAQSFMS